MTILAIIHLTSTHFTVERLEVGGTLLLNTPYKSMEELERNIPENLKKTIAEKKLRVFNIDAAQAAVDAGLSRGLLGGVMEAAFFKVGLTLYWLFSLFRFLAFSLLRRLSPQWRKTWSRLSARRDRYFRPFPGNLPCQAIVDANHKALDNALEGVVEWTVPAEWAKIVRDPIKVVRGCIGIRLVF